MNPSTCLLKEVRVLRKQATADEERIPPYERNERVRVTGIVADQDVEGSRLHYYAAAPADRRTAFSGSGLPYADAEQAFYGSPNVGSVKLTSANAFQIDLLLPNAYYAGLGTLYVPPSVHVWYRSNGNDKQVRTDSIKLGDGIPFRSLTYPTLPTRPRDGAMFYKAAPVLVRSQEQILRDSGYPSIKALRSGYQMPSNFWGLKPPY